MGASHRAVRRLGLPVEPVVFGRKKGIAKYYPQSRSDLIYWSFDLLRIAVAGLSVRENYLGSPSHRPVVRAAYNP